MGGMGACSQSRSLMSRSDSLPGMKVRQKTPTDLPVAPWPDWPRLVAGHSPPVSLHSRSAPRTLNTRQACWSK